MPRTIPLVASTLLLGEYVGVSAALCIALLVGVGFPILLYDQTLTGLCLVVVGLLLTLVFVSLAFLGAVCTRDKARGIGVALMMWFYFGLLYDGQVLFALLLLEEYPVEKATIVLLSLNPIDLGRVIVLLQMDTAALMGLTGAVPREFFGSAFCISYSLGLLVIWIAAPLSLALRVFRRKDL